MKNIAVLSSGTDNSGINAAIRAIVRASTGTNWRIYGVQWGFKGLIDNHINLLTSRDVSGKIGKAGCFLGTGRPEGTISNETIPRILENIKSKQISGMIVIGGKTSLTCAKKIIDAGVPIIGIPSTIQDDIVGTDICLGVDSAVNSILSCVDRIRSCDSTINRTFLVQVEGKSCGSLALRAAIASGADMCLIPEIPCPDLNQISKDLFNLNMSGKGKCLALISGGWKPGIDALASHLVSTSQETDLLVRETILGYVQRGGSPTGFDRLLGTEMGYQAYKAITEGENEKFIAFKNNEFIRSPFSDFIGKTKPVDQKLLEVFHQNK